MGCEEGRFAHRRLAYFVWEADGVPERVDTLRTGPSTVVRKGEAGQGPPTRIGTILAPSKCHRPAGPPQQYDVPEEQLQVTGSNIIAVILVILLILVLLGYV